MADTFSTNLRLLLQEAMGNVNLWGNLFNQGVTDLVEEGLVGIANVDVTSSNVSISEEDGATDLHRPMFLVVTGVPGQARDVIVPTIDKLYILINKTSPSFNVTIKTAASVGRAVVAGIPVFAWVDSVVDTIRTAVVEGNNVTAGPQFITDASTTWNARTAGDLGATINYSVQGAVVTTLIDPVDVTIAATNFELVFGAGVPTAIIPGEPTSPARQYPISVLEAGVPVEAFISIPPANANWLILKADGTLWTNPSQRVIPHKMSLNWETVID